MFSATTLLSILPVLCVAFVPPANQKYQTVLSKSRCGDTSLYSSERNPFQKLKNSFSLGRNSDDASGRLFDIPVESMKLGGLRFTLGLYLIGQQNNPEKGSWKANQADDGVLDFFFQDMSGAISIVFTDTAISVYRSGPNPSLRYLLQESLILHGVLDELHNLAFEGDDIKKVNRLLTLREPGNAIEEARATLPARKA